MKSITQHSLYINDITITFSYLVYINCKIWNKTHTAYSKHTIHLRIPYSKTIHRSKIHYPPNSFQLIQVRYWLTCTLSISCEKCKVKTTSCQKMSLKTVKFHPPRNTCYSVNMVKWFTQGEWYATLNMYSVRQNM